MKGRRLLYWIPILLLALLAVPAGRLLWFYRGVPPKRAVATPALAGLTVPTPAPGGELEQPPAGRGLVLLDRAHDNLFSPAEFSVLTSHLLARGISTRDLGPDDDLPAALRSATALVVATPGCPFLPAEIAAIRHFVRQGGRLLLVADPTRYAVVFDETGEPAFIDSALFLNPLAEPFGLTFEDDYLYNVVEHEGNYQNILLRDFAAVSLTRGLSQVAFYATHSIHSPAGGIIRADARTRSSTDELGRDLAVAALGGEGQALALGDLTFMTSPYAGVLDNGRLLSNIADFLAGAERRYEMADFPYFFGDEVALVPAGLHQVTTAQVLAGGNLQQVLRSVGKRLVFRSEADPARDTFFIGLFEGADAVQKYLDAAGVSVAVEESGEGAVSATLTISGTGEVDSTGMALLYRQQEGSRQVLVLLADTADDLGLALEALSAGKMAGCLALSDGLALCAVGEGGGGGWGPGGDGGEEGGGGGGGSILIVSDDDLVQGAPCFSGAMDYDYVLYEEYTVDTWYELGQGHPGLADLQEYDAVIWSTGSCPGKVPDQEDTETLRQYVGAGGRLLIEGMSMGADWSGTPFYAEVCHAEASGAAAQVDLQVAEGGHPLAKGWGQDQVIAFIETPPEIEFTPDVVQAVGEARAVFIRGPQSEQTGAPSIIAYEGGGARVVYVAFPTFLLPEDEMVRLIQNAAAWLLGK